MRVSSAVYEGDSAVGEQRARALAIHDAIEEQVAEHVNDQWTNVKRIAAAGTALFVIGVGLLFTGSAEIGAALAGIGIVGGAGGFGYVRSQDPDVTVTGVEKGYWTGYLIPDQDGTVVFDATESIQPREFTLELLDDPDRASEIEGTLESIQEFPVVMTDQQDVEGAFIDSLSEIESAIEGAETHEITAPVLSEGDPAIETVNELAPKATKEPVEAGGVSLSVQDAHKQVDSFDKFETMADEDHGESVLLNVSEQSRELANELSGLQETATDLLNNHIQTAGDMFGMVSYYFYCPDCMKDDIESRLELLDKDGEWHCDACRSNFAPGEGIPRHRIRDEVVLDVWDQLWIEKDDERREVYESVEDQKAELEEREFEQRREEIRTAEERIKDIRARIRDLQTEAQAKQGIVEEIGQLMVKYERLNEQKKEQFRRDVSDAFEEIDAQTEEVLKETEGIVQDRIEKAEQEAEKKAETLREEERQRERERVAHEQSRADARAIGVMGMIAVTSDNKPNPKGK